MRNILFCSWIFFYIIVHLCIFVCFLQEIVFCLFYDTGKWK
ncbi:hypothetical protein LEP1GSC016_1547 [Leptospira borgpetersenii serovar Hardjo-bovis str. Sponselee]|uniref:Uncharacterized protein n=1 Tax=Leptospira borgpetersenii serovar Hardjo-bovis str. Sponselee TaxID=1303729 RepID=M6BUX9_LEPBO|nr:hypothetical protein LEP1GSC016_1547 [Leptospira borgpetersenii serovar Hardjo-bovis str. Sponselee]